MPSISDKNRVNQPATIREQDNLNGLTIGKPLPSEYIPGIDVTNYIDPTDISDQGNPDKTGVFGYFKQTVWDKLFGGNSPAGDVAKIRPKTLMGNSNQASSTQQVIRAIVNTGGSLYSPATIVTFSGGGGSGATATPIISNGVIVGIQMTSFGNGLYTSTPTIAFVDTTGSGATATAIVSLGGKISSSLILPEDNTFAAKLDPNTGEYLGDEFYTKEEVANLLSNSNNNNIVYFQDFDNMRLVNETYGDFTPTLGVPAKEVFSPAVLGGSTYGAQDLSGGATFVGAMGGNNGSKIYLFDYVQDTTLDVVQKPTNAIGVITLAPKFFSGATNKWLSVAFPKRKIQTGFNGDRQLIGRMKWPTDGIFDPTLPFYFGYIHDSGSWAIHTPTMKIWFELKFQNATGGGGFVSPYPIVRCTEILCKFNGTTVTVSSPNTYLGGFGGNWNMLKIIYSEEIINGLLVNQIAKFYCNNVLVATITLPYVEMSLYPAVFAFGNDTAGNNLLAIDYIEDIAILPSIRSSGNSRILSYPT